MKSGSDRSYEASCEVVASAKLQTSEYGLGNPSKNAAHVRRIGYNPCRAYETMKYNIYRVDELEIGMFGLIFCFLFQNGL